MNEENTIESALEGEKLLKKRIDELKTAVTEEKVRKIKEAVENGAYADLTKSYIDLPFKLTVGDFDVELTKEQKEKLAAEIKEAKELQDEVSKLDPCDDLGVCNIAANYFAKEVNGPEVQLLYFLIGKNNVQKLAALGYELHKKGIETELLGRVKNTYSPEEIEMLKNTVRMFDENNFDFDLLKKILYTGE